jgi:hypothetical protein
VMPLIVVPCFRIVEKLRVIALRSINWLPVVHTNKQ